MEYFHDAVAPAICPYCEEPLSDGDGHTLNGLHVKCCEALQAELGEDDDWQQEVPSPAPHVEDWHEDDYDQPDTDTYDEELNEEENE